MSQSAFFQVVIGFGNNKGQTTVRLLQQSAQKINRVNIKSQFGPNPKVSIKPISEINLAPFTQMIYKKRDEQLLKQLICGSKNLNSLKNLQQIRKNAQKQSKQLQAQLDFIQNCKQDQNIDTIMSSTGCKQEQAKKYLKKCQSQQKAIESIKQHRKLIDQFAIKCACSKEEAKNFLQANNYDMSLVG